MLVPQFTIDQTDEFLYIRIRVPHVKATSSELHADGCEFSFYCKPYLLKLMLPFEIDGEDEDRCKAVYDPSSEEGIVVAHLPKRILGQYFPDLDLTTRLLRNMNLSSKPKQPSDIEVISSNCTSQDNSSVTSNCQISEEFSSIRISKPRFGFNLRFTDIDDSILEEAVEMKGPSRVPESCRRDHKKLAEDLLFDPYRYLGDFFEGPTDPIYLEAMRYEPFWTSAWNARTTKTSKTAEIEEAPDQIAQSSDHDALVSVTGWTAEQQETLSRLKFREYLLVAGSAEERSVQLGMLDLLVACCYQMRLSAGEMSVEAGRNIIQMSSTLSWLQHFDSARDDCMTVIEACGRRAVVYPYVRHWRLYRKVLADVAKVLYLGKRCIMKCLLTAHSVFEHSETHYIMNKLYVSDYLTWLQSEEVQEGALTVLASDFNQAKRAFEAGAHAGKERMGFFLPEIETWATQRNQQQHDKDNTYNDDTDTDDSDDDEDDDTEIPEQYRVRVKAEQLTEAALLQSGADEHYMSHLAALNDMLQPAAPLPQSPQPQCPPPPPCSANAASVSPHTHVLIQEIIPVDSPQDDSNPITDSTTSAVKSSSRSRCADLLKFN